MVRSHWYHSLSAGCFSTACVGAVFSPSDQRPVSSLSLSRGRKRINTGWVSLEPRAALFYQRVWGLFIFLVCVGLLLLLFTGSVWPRTDEFLICGTAVNRIFFLSNCHRKGIISFTTLLPRNALLWKMWENNDVKNKIGSKSLPMFFCCLFCFCSL